MLGFSLLFIQPLVNLESTQLFNIINSHALVVRIQVFPHMGITEEIHCGVHTLKRDYILYDSLDSNFSLIADNVDPDSCHPIGHRKQMCLKSQIFRMGVRMKYKK